MPATFVLTTARPQTLAGASGLHNITKTTSDSSAAEHCNDDMTAVNKNYGPTVCGCFLALCSLPGQTVDNELTLFGSMYLGGYFNLSCVVGKYSSGHCSFCCSEGLLLEYCMCCVGECLNLLGHQYISILQCSDSCV